MGGPPFTLQGIHPASLVKYEGNLAPASEARRGRAHAFRRLASSVFLARHLQDKGLAGGFDNGFPPIFRIIDPVNPTKLRTSAGVNYFGHEPRPPKPA